MAPSVASRTHPRPRRLAAAVAATALVAGLVAASGPAPWDVPVAVAAAPEVEGDVADEARAIGGATGQDVAATFPAQHRGPGPAATVARSLWWSWTAPASGPVTFTTAGSELATTLEVRTGSADGPVVAANDDDGDVATSRVTFEAEEGEQYLVEVGAQDPDGGLLNLSWQPGPQAADAPPAEPGADAPAAATLTAPQIPIAGNTGEKPQSKVWRAHGTWWAVLASTATTPVGTWVWRYDEGAATWTAVTLVSSRTDVRADVRPVGDVVHVLLHGPSSSLVSLQHVAASNTYAPWSQRTGATAVSLPGSETATIDVDTTGRMWLVADTATTVVARWSDAPYTTFSSPVTLASGIVEDDIALVTRLGGGRVGVLWSNQATERFGFRTHVDGTSPTTWTADESPAAASALDVGDGMADDHLNVALASDGTLYAAVKTSYDSPSATTIGLLVRRPSGAWDPLREVDRRGTRPVVEIDEATRSLRVVYTASEQLDDILEKVVPLDDLDFAVTSRVVLDGSYNNVTGPKDQVPGETLVLAASTGSAGTARLSWTRSGAPQASDGAVATTRGTPVAGTLAATGTTADDRFEIVSPPASGTVQVTDARTGTFVYTPAAGYVGPASFTFRVGSAQVWSNVARVGVAVTDESGLRGRWDLDEGSGTLTADASGWGGQGALSGGATWVAGVAGKAVRLDGTSGRVSVPDSAALDVTGAMTVSAWVRPERVATQYVVKKAVGYETDGYEIGLSSGGRAFFRLNQASGGNSYRAEATSAYPSNGSTWVHLVGVFDGDRVRLYVNGVQQGSVAGPDAVELNDQPLVLGGEPGGAYPLRGAIDGVRLYGKALTAAEVAALHSGTTPPPATPVALPGALSTVAGTPVSGVLEAQLPSGTPQFQLVSGPASGQVALTGASTGTFTYTPTAGFVGTDAFMFRVRVGSGTWSAPATVSVSVLAEAGLRGAWTLDEGSGTLAGDSSGRDLDGTLSGGTTWVDGAIGQAVRFDGTSGRVTVPDAAALDVSSALTVSAWVRSERAATQYVVKKAEGYDVDGYELAIASTGRPFFRVNQASSANAYRADAGAALPIDGTWVHLVGTFDGSRVRLYVDGVEAASVPGPASVGTNALPLVVGDQPAGGYPLRGAVDDVRLYDRALTAQQVAALSAGGDAQPAGPVDPTPEPTPVDPTPEPTPVDPTPEPTPVDPTPEPTPVDPTPEPTDPDPVAPTTPPVVEDASWSTTSGTPVEGTLAISAEGGDAVAVEVVDGPDAGTVEVVDAAAGTLRYVPAAGAVGTDTFTVRAGSGTVWSAPATVSVQVLLAPGVRGVWSFGEASGTTVADSSGWARPGTLTGGASRVAGVHGGAVRLDGASGLVTVPDADALDPGAALTVSAWVRPERVATQYVVKKAQGYEVDGYELGLSAAGKAFFRVNQASAGNAHRVDSTGAYPSDGQRWVHLAGTFDGSRVRLFVDGVEQGSVPGPATVGANALPLLVGNEPGGGYALRGAVDEVTVYDRALSAAEVGALAAPTS
ncbi:LamG-like jellyroll fold domain-containing protein [Cellulosimicrobium cellulans]|uniref:LamG-like jellyroll fold domain-containing protein n=1 Tax=Cellulosimicrobium cellulans TaxID=1710 RepID=UPI00365D5794